MAEARGWPRRFGVVLPGLLLWACSQGKTGEIPSGRTPGDRVDVPGVHVPWVHEHFEWSPGPGGVGRVTGGGPPEALGETVWTSPAFRATEGWDEVLVSWNVVVPAGSSWGIELEVSDAEGARSPWLFLGDWGGWDGPGEGTSETPIVQTCELGRVAVDVFQGTRPVIRARLRARARGPRHAEVRFVRCDLIGSSRSSRGAEGAQPSESSVPWPRALDVPLRSQRELPAPLAPRTCSPTCVSMVLAFDGNAQGTLDVARACFDRRFDLYGNWPRNVQAAFSLGTRGRLARFSSWGPVRAWIERGVPLVCSIGVREGELDGAPYRSTAGHLVVLCGFTSDGDVVVADPAASVREGVRRVYRREQFERVWMVRGGTAYLLGIEGE